MANWVRDYLLNVRVQLDEFPSGAHWLCPAYGDEDATLYNNPDEPDDNLTISEKHRRIQEAAARIQISYKYSLILGAQDQFEEAEEWLRSFKEEMSKQLECYECLKEYYRARRDFLVVLDSEWGDGFSGEFNKLLDEYDIDRINERLSKGQAILKATPTLERKQKVLQDKAPSTLLAISEALCCETFHNSDKYLSTYFDDVFTMVQTNRSLKSSDILPATTHFLFSEDDTRRNFALAAWERSAIQVSSDTFEWAVRGTLVSNIQSLCQMYKPSPSDLQRFWGGVSPILNKLDKSLITECIRNLDVPVNICLLLMQHFSTQSDELLALLTSSFCALIEKSPKDFYEVFGPVSPSTIVEQIFKSPSFPSLLSQSEDYEVDGVTTWSLPFIQSLDYHHQYKACDSLLHHLFERLQTDSTLDSSSKTICLQAGLIALRETIRTFLPDDHPISDLTTRVVVHNILGLIRKYREPIFNCSNLQDPKDIELARLAMSVIRDALKLDCKVIRVESDMIRDGEKSEVDLVSHSIPIWQAVLDAFTAQSLDMAKNVLIGLVSIIGIDQFKATKEDALTEDMIAFNDSFAKLSDILAQLFVRLSDYPTKDLGFLFHNQITAFPMFGTLVSGDTDVAEAMMLVLDSYTGESIRKDALSKLLHESFTESLHGISWAVKKTSKGKYYAPMPRILKVSREALDGLCDTNGGILREKTISVKEQGVVKTFWDAQWAMMTTIFESLEKWSIQPDLPKAVMSDFARDAMDHADALFDQYALLKSSLKVSKGPPRDLLNPLVKSLDSMVKWLRLRDAYLASTLVNLLSKLLRRLGDEDVALNPKDSFSFYYIKDCVQPGPEVVKTLLTEPQKAELRRALELNQGFEQIEDPRSFPPPKKQGKLDAWSKSADGIKHEPLAVRSKTSVSQRPSSFLTPALDSNKPSLDRMRANIERRAAPDKAAKTAEDITFIAKRNKAQAEKAERDQAAKDMAKRLRGGVPGEGSGLRGIGVHGKDHTPKVESIMVDSDSEESEEDDEIVRAELFRNKPTSKGSEIEADRRRQQMQGPVRITKMVRSAKDMRARLSPNMDPLHLTILSWEFFHKGDAPPGSVDCQMITNTFMAAHEYKNTMYPLLIAEAWKDLVTVREETRLNKSKPFDIKIVNRMSVDSYIEVTTTIPYQEMRDQDISDGSIVLLSQSRDPLRDESAPHCLARVFKTARTQNHKDKMDISYRVNNKVQSKLLAALAPGAEIRGVNITTMTTIEREFAALHSLQYYDLCDEILNAKPSPLLNYNDSAITPIERNYKVNKAQAKAILSAKENDAFTLIQGPPGSGKTKTIVAMVGAILTNNLPIQGTVINRPTTMSSNPSSSKAVARKLLICAPSNAAVDEIVSRLKAGVKTMKGEFRKINVIRVGRLSTINQNVQDVSLEKLINARLEGSDEENKAMVAERAKREKLHQDAGELKLVVNSLRSQLDAARASGDKSTEEALRGEYDRKRRTQAHMGSLIENSKEGGNVVGRNKDIKRREIQQELINTADVVCATLSGSGHDMFKNLAVEFETVIIDEAAQCIELSALIPLKYGCSKCILVGDPKQLPPTVLSKMAANFGYEQSLFVRMQKNHPQDIHLLDTQYRMHPEISQFPSQQFYEGKLVDGSDMMALRTQPWHSSPLLGPYRFFDVKGEQQRGHGHSLMNTAEIKVAMQLYKRVTSDYRGVDWKGKVGIITPYKAQLHQLRFEFQRVYGDAIFDQIEFNTTDAFQGREAEVIIFSCVRAEASGGVGFLNDIRRMNVGLTRAKASLWVLGDSKSLIQGPYWSKLITDAQDRGRYTDGNIMSLLSKPSADAQAASSPFNKGVPSSHLRPAPGADTHMERSMRRSSIQDIEMSDATVEEDAANSMDWSKTTSTNAPTTAPPKAPTKATTTEEKGDLLYGNASRVLGAGCSICGNLRHSAVNCDNEDMLGLQGGGCYRCGEPGHHIDRCEKERCLKCGKFGHADRYCVNEPLSHQEKRKVENFEAKFRKTKIERAEKRREFLAGGHDPKIPTIKATVPTPTSTSSVSNTATNGKRRRDPSPSNDMSRKKSTMGSNADGRELPRSENSYSPVPSGPRNMNDSRDMGSNGRDPTPPKQENRRSTPGSNPPPAVRRKKPVDPFIKPKPPRR